MSIFGNPILLGGGSGSIPLVAKADWDTLTTAQKQAYGLAAVQEYTDGYFEGKLFNGADYTSQPNLLDAKYMNGGSSSSIQHTFSSGEFTVIITLTAEKPLANTGIKRNDVDISSGFSLVASRHVAGTNVDIYAYRAAFASGDVLSVTNKASNTNAGVQMFVFDNVLVENIRMVGAINNIGETFMIPQSDYAWYFQVAKWAYYNGINTIPETSVFQNLTEASVSIPCPANQPTYYYGGTYVVTLL